MVTEETLVVTREPNATIVGRAKTSLRYHDLDAYPGVCYFALLPGGSIKIGFSHTTELAVKRMKTLTRHLGAPVIPLVFVGGGWVAEAYYHDKFSDLRLPGDGEAFTYGPALAKFISEQRELGFGVS